MDNFRDLKFQENKLKKGISKITDFKKIDQALELIKIAHNHQKRDEGDPYIIHLIRVTNILIFDLNIRDSNIIIAALLHDAIEDTNITFKEIKDVFGEKVANLVLTLTRDKNKDTKKDNIKKIINGPMGAPFIKACDLLDNIRSMIYRKDYSSRWFRHIKEAEEITIPFVESLKNEWLIKEIKKAYDKVKYEKK